MREQSERSNEVAQLFVDHDPHTSKLMVSIGGIISRPTTIGEVIAMACQRAAIRPMSP